MTQPPEPPGPPAPDPHGAGAAEPAAPPLAGPPGWRRGPPPLPPRAQPRERVEFEDAPEVASVPDTYVPVLPGRRPVWWALIVGLVLLGLGLGGLLLVVPEAERTLEELERAHAQDAGEQDLGSTGRPRSRPWHDPFDLDDPPARFTVDGEPFDHAQVDELRFGSWFLAVGGLLLMLLLGTRRPGRIALCLTCDRDVLAVPRRGWRCERCGQRV